MSYSFSVKAANKAAAKEAVAAELAKVVEQQSIHKKDVDQATAATASMIDLLVEDDTKDICVHVSGSLGWEGDTSDVDNCKNTSSNCNAGAYLTPRAAE